LTAALEPDVRASRLMAAALTLLVCCVFGSAVPAWAGGVALVVGEANYQHAPALPTAGADAADVAAALTDLGFATTLRLDADKRQLDQALAQFARDAKDADAAIFYYAGLGLQSAGHNYLTPADAKLTDAAGVGAELTAVEAVKAAMSAAKGLKIVILDASRDNPFAARLKPGDAAQGLAREDAAAGMIIASAAKAGEIAPDGDGRDSPFTAALLKALKVPGLEVGALFRRVAADVAAATGGAQAPELATSATPEYYLNPSETDQTVWSRIRNGRDVTALEDFISRFPKSAYVPDAIARIELLDARKRIQSDVAAAGDRPPPVRPPEDTAASPPAAAAVAATPAPDLTGPIRDQLRRLGCFAGADADWSSPAMQGALARFARHGGRPVAGADAALLETARTLRPGLCRPPRAAAVAGPCLRRPCPSGRRATVASAGRAGRDGGERCFVLGKPTTCAELARWLKRTRAPVAQAPAVWQGFAPWLPRPARGS
jgi:hypothetical protein